MFLTPFIDFGEPIEKFCGIVSSKHADESGDEATDVEKGANTKPPKQLTLGPVRARIIGTSDKVKILAVNEKGATLHGTGIAIGSGPLDQSKAYLELHIEEDGTSVSVGAIGRNPNTVLSEAWQVLSRVPNSICVPLGSFSKGEVIGVLIDISDFPPSVSAYLGGEKPIQTVSNSVRGDLWPALELTSGSLTVVFNRDHLVELTASRISRGIEAVIISRSIIYFFAMSTSR